MTIASQTLISAVEKLAPKYLAEEWDNVGLLIGDPSRSINKVLLTLDYTAEVIEEAIQQKVDLIVAHHPLIFKPLKQVRLDLPNQVLVAQLLRHDIMYYAAHTNLDNSPLGGSSIIAERLGLAQQEFLSQGYTDPLFKVTVFVPQEYAVSVREQMAKAGAGNFGNYKECFFALAGTGTFRPLDGARPFVGKVGRLEEVAEARLETVVSSRNLAKVIKAMLKAHPYEVPAYDVIATHNTAAEYGTGKVGYLPSALTLGELATTVKQLLGGCPLRTVGDLSKKVRKAAICAGSGGSMINKAIFKGADVLIAGDIEHHEALDALAAGMAVIDPGHYASEWLMVENLHHVLYQTMQAEKREVELILSQVNTEPFKFI